MFNRLTLQNFGPFRDLSWDLAPGINIVIGENGTGKTLLLKLLYALVRAREEYGRGKEKRTFKTILDNKLFWTFQFDKLSDLVTKRENTCHISYKLDNRPTTISFSSAAEKGVGELAGDQRHRDALSIYFPAKEVLSVSHIIKKSLGIDKEFGFDDTYLDLVKALEADTTRGRNYSTFSKARSALKGLLGGMIVQEGGEWIYKKGRDTFPISLTAEGVKRIAIIERLLGNRTLSKKSVLFVDEPEAVLHPKAIITFIEMLWGLAHAGMQIFIATHSYLVLKKLQILAQNDAISTPVLSLSEDGPEHSDLIDGMPANPIVEVSLQLYREELALEA